MLDLQTIQVFGMGHNKLHRPPLLLEILPSSSPNVHIEFELFPEDQKSDYRLHLTVEPLKITYDAVSEKEEEDYDPCLSLFDSQPSADWLNVSKRTLSIIGRHRRSSSSCLGLKHRLLLFRTV